MGLNHGLRGFQGWISSLIRVIRAIRGQAFSLECNLLSLGSFCGSGNFRQRLNLFGDRESHLNLSESVVF